MRVLIIGKGAREHALAWKLSQSLTLTKLYCWAEGPVNPGMLDFAEWLPVDPLAGKDLSSEKWTKLVPAIKQTKIDLVLCGPEAPLAEGIADTLREANIAVFGPVRQAAQLESSKAFAKEIMSAAGIPTAKYRTVHSSAQCREVAHAMLAQDGAVVLKASGLAAGKGVFVCESQNQLEESLQILYSDTIGDAASEVVVEECLRGRECSYFVAVSGEQRKRLGFAVDYKRLLEGDLGPNTGGMGCYTPVPWLPEDAAEQVDRLVVEPLLATLEQRKIQYVGWLYVGLMWTKRGPAVIEFNVRLGDPEAQVLAVSDSSDWLEDIVSLLSLKQKHADLPHKPLNNTECNRMITVGMVLASKGYPFATAQDQPTLLQNRELFGTHSEPYAFFASVQGQPSESTGKVEELYTGSGRVMTIVSQGQSYEEARLKNLAHIDKIQATWPDCQVRRDVARFTT